MKTSRKTYYKNINNESERKSIMKKKLLTGVLATALVLGVGTTAYVSYAKGVDYRSFMQQQGFNVNQMEGFMEQQGIDVDQMYELMNSGASYEDMQKFMQDQNINFGQMYKYMQQVYPDLKADDFKAHYESMHGTVGSSNSNNFTGMNGFSGMMGQ
ncbi:MAG: UTP--glucose-1-phosphate uridylyltransferase [Tepidibacillus sp.]|uniref:UTP--glucose-1-phosphate uridylyltransferase n=1 Tax=Tepidibacillus sp. HK-1 TaxID=1883407 RepID=UPI0015EBED40|nr:UTP--glucose-1-phosphate uridylyltransferase [Tepidibacillus sp. HK-1]